MRRCSRWSERSSRAAASTSSGTRVDCRRAPLASVALSAIRARPARSVTTEGSPSLSALLDVRTDELLGVGLEDAVDRVEQVVELFLQGLALPGGCGLLDDFLALGRRRFLLLLTLGHSNLPWPYEPSSSTSW